MNTHLQTYLLGLLWFIVCSINLERWLADQTLVDDCPYAPQVGLGIIVLGHDDLWGLREERSQSKAPEQGALCNIVLRTLMGRFKVSDLSCNGRTVSSKTH